MDHLQYNLLLLNKDDLNTIKLIDFGMSRKVGKNEIMTNSVGTPYYVAPEILKGNYDK